jgi:hypothetical protein
VVEPSGVEGGSGAADTGGVGEDLGEPGHDCETGYGMAALPGDGSDRDCAVLIRVGGREHSEGRTVGAKRHQSHVPGEEPIGVELEPKTSVRTAPRLVGGSFGAAPSRAANDCQALTRRTRDRVHG